MSNPWYEEGLAFRCTRCGNCCTGAPGVVWVDDEEMRAIADRRHEEVGMVERLFTRLVGGRRSLRERANGDCVFWDREAGCTVYPVRPRQCRTWPFWESTVATPESWEETRQQLSGSGAGGPHFL